MTMLTTLTMVVLLGVPADEVLARVDGWPVTAGQWMERVKTTQASGGSVEARGLLEDLVNDELLSREGYKQGLDKGPAAVAAFEAARRRLAGQRFLEEQVYANVKIDEAQVKALFHDTGDSVRLKMIILASEEEARALVGRLEKGAKLEDEAKHSLDPAGVSKKGNYGDLTRGQLEGAAREAAFTVPLGKPFGPVKLLLGFAVMVVDARTLADEAKLPARRAEIAGFAEAQGRLMVKKHIVTQLRTKYKVTVDQAFLQSTGTRLAATAAEAERVLAKVGDRAVTYGAVLRQQQKSFGGTMGSHMSGYKVKEELAWSEVDQLVVEAAAIEAGFGKAQETLEVARRDERDAVIRELANRARAGVPAPTPAAIQTFFDAHRADYTRPPRRTCSHLVVRDEANAKALRAQVGKSARFEELAAKNSLDQGSAAHGGLLGELDDPALDALGKQGEPALAAALRSATPEAVSEPVKGSTGWHLVRCGSLTPAQRLSLDEVRPGLTERAWQEQRQAAMGHLIERLRQGAKVTFDEAALQRAVTLQRRGEVR